MIEKSWRFNSSPAHPKFYGMGSTPSFGTENFTANVMSIKNYLLYAIFLLSIILNFYQLDKNPPGLYIDEVSIGVNAYSILKTGQDEAGARFPIYFKAYGDYKLPVYIYLTSISMLFFGKNEFAVRFPSAFLGTLTICLFYLLLAELLKTDTSIVSKYKNKFALLATFLLSASPWYMHFVGPAFEATVALFFFVAASYLYILFKRLHHFSFFILSLFSFVITFYTYNSYKIITPIILFLVTWDLLKNKDIYGSKFYYYIMALFFPLFAIIHTFFLNPSNVRFLQTSAFSHAPADSLILFLKNYLSYYSLDFLFNSGDGINRHQFLDFGILSRWSLPFLLAGFYSLIKSKRSQLKYLAFGLLAIAPIPGAMALPSPHTLRSLQMVIPYTILISMGISVLLNRFSKYAKLFMVIICCFFIYEFSIYLHYSFYHYTKTALIDWGGNFKEVVQKAAALQSQYPYLLIDVSLTNSIEYFRFYNDTSKPVLINSRLNKQREAGNKSVLYITSDISKEPWSPGKLIDTVYLPNDNKNIFAQFWEL